MAKVLIASDHAGYALKMQLIPLIQSLGYETEDLGDNEPNPTDDYPDYIIPLSARVSMDDTLRGVIIGGSGEGEAMTANRFHGIRAAVYYGGSMDVPRLMREHNNANVLSLGARLATEEEAKQALEVFLKTPFSGDERHVRRLAKF